MKRKNFWKIVIVSSILIFAFPVAPEIGMLVALVDVIGLDILLLLFEVQAAVLIGAMYQQRIKPALIWINAKLAYLDPYYFVPTRYQVKACPASMVHSVPFLVGATLLAVAVVPAYA